MFKDGFLTVKNNIKADIVAEASIVFLGTTMYFYHVFGEWLEFSLKIFICLKAQLI